MSSLNQQLELIRQSPTVAMNDRIVAFKAAGNPVIPLQVGDPDFATPQAVLEVAFEEMRAGLTHYGPSQGFLDLRKAAALKLERDNAVVYDPGTEILVTHGGIHAFYVAMQAILNPGDEVLIPIQVGQRTPIWLPCCVGKLSGFQPRLKTDSCHLLRIGSRRSPCERGRSSSITPPIQQVSTQAENTCKSSRILPPPIACGWSAMKFTRISTMEKNQLARRPFPVQKSGLCWFTVSQKLMR